MCDNLFYFEGNFFPASFIESNMVTKGLGLTNGDDDHLSTKLNHQWSSVCNTVVVFASMLWRSVLGILGFSGVGSIA